MQIGEQKMFVQSFVDEYERYRIIADKAIGQVPDDAALNRIVAPNGNSIAMLMRHVGGNLMSRFTDFGASDGEKSWRDRDGEFGEGPFARADAEETWNAGWNALTTALSKLTDDDLTRVVTIRNLELSIHEALTRSVTHVAMHVGQIILLARMLATDEWKWISIPKGQSKEYNLNPTLEKASKR
jgi:hypothetical protein